MTKKLLGSKVVNEIIINSKKECSELKEQGINPQIAVVRVGNNASDISYEKSIMNFMEKADISVKSIVLDENIKEDELLMISKIKNRHDEFDDNVWDLYNRGYSMESIAKMLNVNKTTISNVIRGKYK